MIYRTEVEFHIDDRPEKVAALVAKAREWDLINLGEGDVPASYTVEQAFTVVWHTEPEWLVAQRILVGWSNEDWKLWPTLGAGS